MTKIQKNIKLLVFLVCFVVVLCASIFKAIYYYVNGQSIASAHLDGHDSAAILNFLCAVILIILLYVIFKLKKPKGIIKWSSIPIMLLVFSLVHFYIGSLFECCPEPPIWW